MKKISNNTDFAKVIAGDKPVVLDFYADWCAPCRALLPVLEAASSDYSDDIVIAKINVDENPEIAKKFSVRSIPAVFLMKNGTLVDQFTGVQSKTEINRRIDNLYSKNFHQTALKTARGVAAR